MRRHALTLSIAISMLSGVAHAQVPAPPPRKPATPSAYDQALRIARMLHDDRAVASVTGVRLLEPNLSVAEIRVIVKASEALGRPELPARQLELRIARYPEERDARVELALLRARSGEVKAAIAVWKEIGARFGLTTAERVTYAQLLSTTGDLPGAFAVLKAESERVESGKAANDNVEATASAKVNKVKGERTNVETAVAPTTAVEATPVLSAVDLVWEGLAALAWELDDSATALVAYRHVWASNPESLGAGPRLMMLAHEAGELDEAIGVALASYVNEKNPAHLLSAASYQAEKGDWVAVKGTLSIRELAMQEYWTLRGDAHVHLGELPAARVAFQTALRLNVTSAAARAALLWLAIEMEDLHTLATDLAAWHNAADGEPLLWGPFAAGLDRLGRTAEAIPFFEAQLRATPADYAWMLDYADALERVGQHKLAFTLRRRAFQHLRKEARQALADPRRSEGAARLLEKHADVSRALLGAPEGERWLDQLLAARKPSAGLEAFAVAWYLADGRIERARRHMALARRRGFARTRSAEHDLTLALADHDVPLVEELIASPAAIPSELRLRAAIEIERDDLALPILTQSLERPDLTGDHPEQRRELRDLGERHWPTARAGGAYQYIAGLHVMGPDVGVAQDVGAFGGARVVYSAYGRQIAWGGGDVRLDAPVIEADAFALGRIARARRISEIGLGANYQRGRPAPRLEAYDLRELSRAIVSSIDLRLDARVEDTPFLRVTGLRDQLAGRLNINLTRRVYVATEVLVQEDHTRDFQLLGVGAGANAELGYRLHASNPEWGAGVQLAGVQRSNSPRAPGDSARFVPPSSRVDNLLPVSYESVAVVMHFTRGDIFQRHAADGASFPRYDCDAALGVLIPSQKPEGHARCSASIRVGNAGFATALAEYALGVAGLPRAYSAQGLIAYTHYLR